MAASPPIEARSTVLNLDIPSESLKDALETLALVSDYKLLYSSELVDGRKSPPLKGEFTTEEAVKMLLSGTDLKYEVTADGLLLIRAPDTRPPTSLVPRDAGEHQSRLAQEGGSQADSANHFRLPHRRTPTTASPPKSNWRDSKILSSAFNSKNTL